MNLNRLAIGVVVAGSVALVVAACGSDDSGDSGSGGGAGSGGASGSSGAGASGGTGGGATGGNGGSGGGSGGSSGGSGGGSAGDASTGGTAGAPIDGGQKETGGGPCGPLSGSGDSACDQCLNTQCCNEFKDCANDANCTAIITCLQGGQDLPTCIAAAGSQGAVFTALGTCRQTNCGSQCN